MTTIKLSSKTKQRLEQIMGTMLKIRVSEARGKARDEVFVQLARNRYGMSFDSIVGELIDYYTKNTK